MPSSDNPLSGNLFQVETPQGCHICITFYLIIPHVKMVRCDWLTKVGHSIMSTGEMSTGKTSTVLTGSIGSHCCFHWYFTKMGFVRYNKTNTGMPCQCGYPDGMSPSGDIPSGYPHWHGIFVKYTNLCLHLYNIRANLLLWNPLFNFLFSVVDTFWSFQKWLLGVPPLSPF